MTPDQDAIVLAALPTLHRIAGRMVQEMPGAFEDFVAAGALGLVRAVLAFDPTRCALADRSTYLSWKMRQAIVDAVRVAGLVGAYRRPTRRRPGTGPPPIYRRLDDPARRSTLVQPGLDPEAALLEADQQIHRRRGLRAGWRLLVPRERACLRATYVEGQSHAAQGRALHVTAYQMFALHHRALETLRGSFGLVTKRRSTHA